MTLGKLIFHRYYIKSIIYNKNLITWTRTKLNDLEMTPLRGWKDNHIESATMDNAFYLFSLMNAFRVYSWVKGGLISL